MQTILAVLAALPKILQLVQFFLAKANDAEQRGIGRKEAIAEAVENMHKDLALADAAEQQGLAAHATHADDSAFDQSFQRTDSGGT
jgi:hypothetical protein